MAKPLEDVTFEDLLRYKGSRWKKTITDGGVDVDGFLDDLSTFLNDVPECRNVRAYVLMGDDPKKLVFKNDCEYIDMFYKFYTDNIEIIDSIRTGVNTDIEVTNVETSIDDVQIDVSANKITKIESEINDAEYSISRATESITSLDRKIERYAWEIASRENEIEKLEKDIENIRGVDNDISLVSIINKAYKSMSDYGFQPYYESYETNGVVIIVFCAPPRFMYDVNIPTRKPMLTMPLDIEMRIYTDEMNAKLYSNGSFTNYCPHPHVSSGNICWGGLRSTVATAMLKLDFDTMFKSLDKLIRSYNSGSPFITWSSYARTQNYSAWCKFKTDDRVRDVSRIIKRIINRMYSPGGLKDIPIENLIGEQMAQAFISEYGSKYEEIKLKAKEKYSEKTDEE